MERRIQKFENHIIICGLVSVDQQVLHQLHEDGIPLVVIDQGAEAKSGLLEGVLYIDGDATEDNVLEWAGIERASGLVATLPDDAKNVFVALTARGMNAKLQIVARTERKESEETPDRSRQAY